MSEIDNIEVEDEIIQPVLEETPSDSTEETEAVEEKQTEKVFTQDEVNRIVQKEKEKVKRRLERESKEPKLSTEDLVPEKFKSQEAYYQALIEQHALQKAEELLENRKREEIKEKFIERQDSFREKTPDYDSIVLQNSSLNFTSEMVDAIIESEVGPELAYALSKNNGAELKKISKLSKSSQLKELGKLEAKLSNSPTAGKVSSAPAPVRPLSGNSNSAKSVAEMSVADYANNWETLERKRLEALYK